MKKENEKRKNKTIKQTIIFISNKAEVNLKPDSVLRLLFAEAQSPHFRFEVESLFLEHVQHMTLL